MNKVIKFIRKKGGHTKMFELLRKGMFFGLGLAVASKEQIEKAVDELVKKGEIAPSESKKVVEQIVERGQEEQQKVKKMVNEQVNNVLKETEIPTKDEFTYLEKRVEKLEERIRELEANNSSE